MDIFLSILFMILLATGLIAYGLFLRRGVLPILDLIEYAKEHNLEVFDQKYHHYYFAMSNPFFMLKLLFGKELSDNPVLSKKISTARNRYRSMITINLILFACIFFYIFINNL